MPLNNLIKTTTRSAKRLGRGLASGKGKTAGRGTKGQKSRSGYNIPRRFEGGQTSMIARLPKARGFHSKYQKPLTLTVEQIEGKFDNGDKICFETLIEKGLIKNNKQKVKIIGGNKFSKNFILRDVILSAELLKNYSKPETDKIPAEKVEIGKPQKEPKIDKKPTPKKTPKTTKAKNK